MPALLSTCAPTSATETDSNNYSTDEFVDNSSCSSSSCLKSTAFSEKCSSNVESANQSNMEHIFHQKNSSSNTSDQSSTSNNSLFRILPNSVVVVPASQSTLAMTQIKSPNFNPILTNIKSINVIKQKSTNVLNQTHPATLIGGIPGLNMTFDSETSKHLGSTSIQSTFSDDEDESIGNDGQIKVPPIKKFKKNMIPSTNSSQPISSLKQPRPNRLPSFSSGNNNVKSNVTIGSTSTMITPQTLASNLSNINYKTSNVSPVKTIATNNQNASEYIANILNSTVMNISSANNNCGPVQHPPQSSHHQQDINSTHYVVTNTVPVIVTSDEFKNGNLKTDVKHVNGMTTVTSVFDSASPIVSSLDSGTISSEVLIIDDISQDSVLSSSSLDSSLQYRSFTVPLTSDHDVIVSDQLEFQKSVNEEELIQNIESIKDETIKKHLMLFHNKRFEIKIQNKQIFHYDLS